ncbi:MAG: glycosyltransferase [Hyphomicrobiaceae bacterium]
MALGVGAIALIVTAPSTAQIFLQIVFALAFALLLTVRLLALWHAIAKASGQRDNRLIIGEPRTELPVYSVLIALHAEVPVVPQLVKAMRALDYPADNLDIIFALEAHDEPTRAALLATSLPPHMRLITVPAGLPRTKPRALCYALSFARGDYVVVYDAEDIPDPRQLRIALTAFESGSANLGCLQASLAINNAHASWLTAQFAIEYTALFDAILPAFAHHGLPVPLGGTSNHFRREALDASGGWDPWNVTEDADLGFRLARAGWHVGVLHSTTWEEAPAEPQPWLAQRTRWQKGWLQTYFVHMRNPVRLWRELGPKSFIWFQIVLGGGLFATLAHPWFYAMLAFDFAQGNLFPALKNGPRAWLWWAGIVNLTIAAGTTIVLALLALKRRGRTGLYLHALMSPLYWLPISIGSYRAIIEWIRAPFYWAKTPHGTLTLTDQAQETGAGEGNRTLV